MSRGVKVVVDLLRRVAPHPTAEGGGDKPTKTVRWQLQLRPRTRSCVPIVASEQFAVTLRGCKCIFKIMSHWRRQAVSLLSYAQRRIVSTSMSYRLDAKFTLPRRGLRVPLSAAIERAIVRLPVVACGVEPPSSAVEVSVSGDIPVHFRISSGVGLGCGILGWFCSAVLPWRSTQLWSLAGDGGTLPWQIRWRGMFQSCPYCVPMPALQYWLSLGRV